MTFEDVARVIGSSLPESARKHRPWWANEATGHTHAKAWLAAGYEATQVDMPGRKLVFRRITRTAESAHQALGMAEDAREFERPSGEKRPRRHPAFGALKGTFTIEPGYDLTKPTMDDDEIAEMEANLERTADLIDQGMKGKRT